MKKIKCFDCNKELFAHGATKRCIECNKEHIRKRDRERYKRMKADPVRLRKKREYQRCWQQKEEQIQKRIIYYEELENDPIRNRQRLDYLKEYREKNKVKAQKYGKKYRKENKQKLKIYRKEYANSENGKSVIKKYFETNKDKIKETKQRYRNKNQHLFTERENKRNAIKKSAILSTTNFNKIKKIYEQAKQMENEAGIKYHVDHIIPLAIGGAHHQDNLRIIPSKDNISKGKKYDPTLGGKWANNNKARYTKKKLGIR